MTSAIHIEAKITEGLIEHFSELSLPDGVDVALPNETYVPDASPFVRLSVQRNSAMTRHLGGEREPIRRGFFQASIFWPNGAGITDALNLAGTIRDKFAYNTEINHAGVRIRIVGDDETNVGGEIEDDGYVHIPIVIPWLVT